MANDKLLKTLSRLGLPMFEPSEELDVNATLAEVVTSRDLRLWESFPVLLANASENYRFAPEMVERQLLDAEFKKVFQRLLLMTVAVYDFYHLSFAWAAQLQKSFSAEDKAAVKDWRQALKVNQWPSEQEQECDPQRVKVLFELYYEQRVEKERRRKDKQDEFSLEFALSQLFPPKQKQLFRKKLEGDALSKTEQEYYSRTVKKKVVALANSELHSLARKLLEL